MPRARAADAVAVVIRTTLIPLRETRARRQRLYGLLVSAGDVWAWVLDCNRQRRQWNMPPVVNFQALCQELSHMGVNQFGELGSIGARSVLKRYSVGWFAAAGRAKDGDPNPGFPRRKRRLMPVKWYHSTFGVIDGTHVRLGLARGAEPLVVRLQRPIPYDLGLVRSVELVHVLGEGLMLAVTAEVPVEFHDNLDPSKVVGVDLGIIHPIAAYDATTGDGLLVSGRGLRAECRLHLEDTKQRDRAKGRKRGPERDPVTKQWKPGSRRHKKQQQSQNRAEKKHRRRIRQAHRIAARELVEFAVAHDAGTLVVGDPVGVLDQDAGRVQNKRVRDWQPGHLKRVIAEKAAAHGIVAHFVDERGTTRTCPECGNQYKPRGRVYVCKQCGFRGHRDLVGARNIAARYPGGGIITAPPSGVVEHRRVGDPPERRDRRRHLWDQRRQTPVLPGSGPPSSKEKESLAA